MKDVDYQKKLMAATDQSRRDAVVLTILSSLVMVIFIVLATTAYMIEPLFISVPLIFVLGMAQGAFIAHVIAQWSEYFKFRDWQRNHMEQ